MRVNHRRFDVAMAQQLLNGSNVIAAFKDVCGEGMPECVACGPLREPGLRHGASHGFLHQRFVNVMTALFVGLAVDPSVVLGKHPLPAPVLWRVGILAVEGVWKQDAAPPIG